MKNIKKKVLILLVIFTLTILPINSIAKYYEEIKNIKLYFYLAKPILKIEKSQNTIIKEISRKSEIENFYFTIKNYELINNEKVISEVPFFIDLELNNSNKNFPIEYKIYDCDTGNEIKNKIFVDKNIEFEKRLKIMAIWNKNSQNSEYNETNIIFNVEQAI